MSTPTCENLCLEAHQALQAGDHERAKDCYVQALGLNGNSLEAHEGLANVNVLDGEFDDAIHHLKRVAQLDPRQGRPLINIGALYNRMGQSQKAIESLRQGIQKDKKCPDGFFNMGIAHRALNQNSMAISAYKEAIRLAPDLYDAYLNLAQVYLDMANHQQATATYRKILEQNPGNEQAIAGLKAVEQAANQAKQEFSPFGRLVEEDTGKSQPRVMEERVLTVAERLDDRHALHSLTREIEDAATAWLNQIKDELQPALLAMNRSVTQGHSNPFMLADSYEEFDAAVAKWHEAWEILRRKILELRGHEEFKNTPELKLPGMN